MSKTNFTLSSSLMRAAFLCKKEMPDLSDISVSYSDAAVAAGGHTQHKR